MGRKRGGRRKVTKEMADYIRRKHEEGYIYSEILESIRKKYEIELHPATVTRYYKGYDEVIEEYKTAAGKQKRERYDRMYHRHYRHFDKLLSNVFSKYDTLSLDEISSVLKEKIGIDFKKETIKKKIDYFQERGEKPILEEIEPEVYKIKK